MLAALAVLVSAGVHRYLWFDLFSGAHVVGPAFMVNAISGVVIAILLVTWRHWIPSLLAVGFGVATLGAFIISTRSGLHGIHETWTTWEAWTAAAAEVVAIVTGGTLLLLVENPLRSGGTSSPTPRASDPTDPAAIGRVARWRPGPSGPMEKGPTPVVAGSAQPYGRSVDAGGPRLMLRRPCPCQ